MSKRSAGFLLALGAISSSICLAQPEMVKDVSTQYTDAPNYSAFKVEFGGRLYFMGTDGIHGWELWATNGTLAGTEMVKDLCPGACSGFFNIGMVTWNAKLYFVGNDGASGPELFATDGTEVGTSLVKDIVAGRTRGVEGLFAASGRLYLVAAKGDFGVELWTSLGTAASTVSLSTTLARLGHFFETDGVVLFFADAGSNGGELWKSDGTLAGTGVFLDLVAGPQGVTLDQQWALADLFRGKLSVALAGDALFLARVPSGTDVWRTDGTALGTTQLWSSTSLVRNLVTWGAHAYWLADDGLWRTDGTLPSTALVVPGNFRRLQALNGGLLMYGSAGSGSEPFFSDGTPGGTAQVLDLNPGPDSSSGPFEQSFVPGPGGAHALFWAQEPTRGLALWRTDGTALGTVAVADEPPGPAGAVAGFNVADQPATFGSQSIFTSRRDASSAAIGLFSTGGSTATLVHPLNVQTSLPPGFSVYVPDLRFESPAGTPDGAYFKAAFPAAHEVWFTDGTEAATQPVVVGQPNETWFLTGQPLGDRMLLVSRTGLALGDKLWSSESGGVPVLLASGNLRWPQGGRPGLVDGATFFANGFDLWRTDGQPSGTGLMEAGAGVPVATHDDDVLLTRFDPPLESLRRWREGQTSTTLGSFSPYWTEFASFAGHQIFFVPGFSSLELHEIVGASTAPITTVPTPQPFWSVRARATPFGVFFTTADAGGIELWITDGTSLGTHRLVDISPGPRSSEPESFVFTTTALFFAADDGVHGRELWTSDGTEAGTRMVKDLVPGPGSGLPDQLYVADGLLIFSATDGVHGKELWVSNGTEAGTIQLQDIAPGGASSTPQQFTIGKDQLFFLANDTVHGFELWRLARTDLATLMTAPAAFFTLTPCRLYDSRDGSGPLTGGGQRSLAAHGSCGVPEGARSVAANLTVVGPTASGSLFIGANDGVQSLLELPLVGGETRATQALLRLSTTGDGTLRATANFPSVGSAGSVDWVLDVVGYFE